MELVEYIKSLKSQETSNANALSAEKMAAEFSTLKDLCLTLNNIIENSSDGIYITDGEANTVLLNKAYEQITGIRRQDVLGRNMRDIIKEGLISESTSLQIMKHKKTVTIEQVFSTGKKALTTTTPIFDRHGNLMLMVGCVRDITLLSDLQEKYQNSKALSMEYRDQIDSMRNSLLVSSTVISEDPKMYKVLEIAQKVARLDTTVLISGETGVGKEEVAKYILKNSVRADRNYVELNCSALPSNLIESELFGYDGGAFTDAKKQGKKGMFELADKGTIFLDEIGELPLDAQAKLLRVLEERRVKRIGGSKGIPIDVRIIAATNVNLGEMVAKRLFRDDLYFRLNVVQITIPPLRERKKDIIPLAMYFLSNLNEKYKLQKRFSSRAIHLLTQYTWPGNVRELKNAVERAVIISAGDEITGRDLECQVSVETAATLALNLEGDAFDLKRLVAEIELKAIDAAYERFGNVQDAGAFLGIGASTLVRKRKKYRGMLTGQDE